MRLTFGQTLVCTVITVVCILLLFGSGCTMLYEAGEMAKGTIWGAAKTVGAGVSELQNAGLNSASNASIKYGNGQYQPPRIVE